MRLSPIGDLQEQRAVGFGGILGPVGHEVRGKLDFAVAEIDGVAQIDNAGVVGIVYADGVEDLPGESLVGTTVAKNPSVEHIRARLDFDTSNARLQRRAHPNQKQQKSKKPDNLPHTGQSNTAGTLLNAIAPRVQAGVHRTAVVHYGPLQVYRACRIEAGLRDRPLVTLELVIRGLLLGLAIARIHEDIRGSAPIAPRSRVAVRHNVVRAAVGGARLRHIGRGIVARWRRLSRLVRAAAVGHRRGICRYITVVARVPGVVGVVVVVVRRPAPVVSRVPERQYRQEPGKSHSIVDARPEPAAPVATAPVASRATPARMTVT